MAEEPVQEGGEIKEVPGEEVERIECRFYENQFPEVHELVMVNVKAIAEMGAYVSLLEYNNIEGMILLSELSRRRIRSINKLIRVGKNEIVMVLRVDKEKGYIDLSKRRVSPEDIAKCEERFNKAKTVHSVLRQAAQATETPLEELYQKVGWPCYKKFRINTDDDEPNAKPQYMHAYDVFKMSITDKSVFDGYDLTQEELDALSKFISRRMTPQPIKIRADIEVTCYNYEGIDAIKEALSKGENVGSDDSPVKIKLIAPPLYVMTINTLDKQKGLDTLTQGIEVIRESITAKGGSLVVKMEPKVVSQHEERELSQMMERLQMENREVDGDAPEED